MSIGGGGATDRPLEELFISTDPKGDKPIIKVIAEALKQAQENYLPGPRLRLGIL